MMLLYSIGLALALGVSAPWWLTRMALTDRYREGLGERLGRLSQRLRGDRKVIWLHTVSVGELLAASRLIAEMDAALPEYRVVISTTTKAGQALARQRFGADRVFYFPLDFAFAVRRVLKTLQPSMLVLVESELWPRVLMECERADVPVVVVNARVSDRSYPRYKALRWLWRPLLQKVTLMLAQSDEDAARWRELGTPRVLVSGNMKFDVKSDRDSAIVALLQDHLPADATLLVCGSTLEGEESRLLECWRKRSAHGVLLLAPRHPQRFAEVEKLAEQRGVAMTKLSEWRVAPAPIAEGSVLLLDSIGELASVYSIAGAAFIGGSVVPMAGHNPLEAAQFGVPVVMGTSYENFRSVVRTMMKRDAIRVVEANDLCGALQAMLAQPDTAMGARGREVFAAQAGATDRTLGQLTQILRERA